ncbi:MAG: hypothetical protein M1827_006264 [Pycnora praestabilis]|nr:MAG: hypothetical protein M1827_006264 [Pycnora praestabilis]
MGSDPFGSSQNNTLNLGAGNPSYSNARYRISPWTVQNGDTSYSAAEDYPSSAAWDPCSVKMHQLQTFTPQSCDSREEYFGTPSTSIYPWNERHCDEIPSFQHFDAEINYYGGGFTNDDEFLSLLEYGKPRQPYTLNTDVSRRLSGSSFSLSSTGPACESLVEESLRSSEESLCSTQYPSATCSNYSANPLSSATSPDRAHGEFKRAGSRSRASPSPRSRRRTAPYSIDNSRNKRWSTGSNLPAPACRSFQFVPQAQEFPHTYNAGTSLHRPSSNFSRTNARSGDSPLLNNFSSLQSQHVLRPSIFTQSANLYLGGDSAFLPTSLEVSSQQVGDYPQSSSQDSYALLHSNANLYACHEVPHINHTEPPNLYAALHEDQLSPPPEDMNISDPELIPHKQELRFEGDLYTPQWVRGHGNKREGWCGICKPGRWLVLKNSAFWYDKSFSHGVSATTGLGFREPQETRRMDGNPDVWEGLCGSCNEWIALVSSKKKGTTWFRHAYKCHTHQKIKDAPKRRRDSGHVKVQSNTTATRNKAHSPKLKPTASKAGMPRKPKTTTALESLANMI